MKALIPFLILSSFSTPVFAYKMTIYTDQPDESKANEVVNTFKNTFPFNQFEIEYEVKKVPAEALNCKPYEFTKADGTKEVITRNLSCDSANIAQQAAANGSDQAIIVKNVSDYGGSGGSIPVMSAGSPSRMMLHEYLHALGLCDEYEYAASETEAYCGDNAGGPNMTVIAPKPNGYASDAAAKGEHSGNIPWNEFIKPLTKITRGTPLTLGTDSVNFSVRATPNPTNGASRIGAAIGLYEGKTCKNATPPKKTWQPGGESTIMDVLDAGLGAGNEMMVAKILESRGVRRKAIVAESTPASVNADARGSKNNEVFSQERNTNSNSNISK